MGKIGSHGRALTLTVMVTGTVMASGPVHAQEVVELPGEDRSITLDLVERYTLGGIDVPPWQEFQDVNDAAFGPDGRLYLLDAQSRTVIAVGPDGGLLHTVGRRGEGPGEHELASGLAVLSDGRVVIWDFGDRSLLIYDADGKPLDEVRPDFSAGRPDDPFVRLDDHTLLASPLRVTMSDGGISYLGNSGVTPARRGWPILRVPVEDGRAADVFAYATLFRWSGTGDPPIHRAFQPWPTWGAVGGGRLAVHQSEDYRIDILDSEGVVERVLTRPIPARETDSAARSAYARDLRRKMENGEVISMGASSGGGTIAARVRDRLEETWYYPRITPILQITGDGQGHLWVQRRDPDDPTLPGPIDILSVTGRYLGTLAAVERGLPEAFGPNGLVAFVEEGRLDVPLVRVFRLPEELR